MRLTRLLFFTMLFALCICSCTDGEDFIEFESRYKNESGAFLSIKGFNRNNQIEYQYSLENNDVSPTCKERSTRSLGPWCGADSLVISFENGKGYICTSRGGMQSNLCFLDGKSPFGAGDQTYYREIGENAFEFIITESDLENAFELPPDQ